jgi:1,4-alpha-glucan branching enzyme
MGQEVTVMTDVKRDGQVEFRFYRPGVNRVELAGDFNDWKPKATMSPDGEGWWVAVVPLPPGEYRFRYLADGRWFTDFAANGVEQTPLGWNGIVVVPDEKSKHDERTPGEHRLGLKDRN